MSALAGKTVLLTGASRGIGASMALAIAKEGATVVGVSRSKAGLAQVQQSIESEGGKMISLPADISQVSELAALAKQINNIAGTIDVLINNAAIEIYRAFQNYSLNEIQQVLSTNLLAAVELSRLLLPDMLAQQEGHIINIASLAAKKGHPYDSVYSASKAGLLMWADAIRQELSGTGVIVSTVCPGYVKDQGLLSDTKMSAPRFAGVSMSKDVVAAVLTAIKTNRAEVVLNENAYLTLLTQLLFAVEQFSPRFGDMVNRWLGVPQLNSKRADIQSAMRQNSHKVT